MHWAQWVADHIFDTIATCLDYAPGMIIKDIKRAMGVTVSYQTTSRARELCKTSVLQYSDSYRVIMQPPGVPESVASKPKKIRHAEKVFSM